VKKQIAIGLVAIGVGIGAVGTTAASVSGFKYWNPNSVIKCNALIGSTQVSCLPRHYRNGDYFVSISDRQVSVARVTSGGSFKTVFQRFYSPVK
jgi:hypothetical protein